MTTPKDSNIREPASRAELALAQAIAQSAWNGADLNRNPPNLNFGVNAASVGPLAAVAVTTGPVTPIHSQPTLLVFAALSGVASAAVAGQLTIASSIGSGAFPEKPVFSTGADAAHTWFVSGMALDSGGAGGARTYTATATVVGQTLTSAAGALSIIAFEIGGR